MRAPGPSLRPTARVMSAVGRAVGVRRWYPLDEEWVLARARERTGLSDWGDGDFREPLRLLLSELDRRGPPMFGRIGALDSFARAVANRLRVREALRLDPGVTAIHVARPLVVVGLHPGAVTRLHRLLAALPDMRALRYWEAWFPVAPPEGTPDTRRKEAGDLLRIASWLAPEGGALRPRQVDDPEWCWPLFLPTFAVARFALQQPIPDYTAWLLEQDMTGAYRHYANVLRLLLRQGPRQRLVLAGTEHLWSLDALLRVFRDAGVVWVHDDPVTSAAAFATLATQERRTLLGRSDPTEVGPDVAEGFGVGLWRAMRERQPDDQRFLDLDHLDLLTDPVAALARIADHFELGWGPEHEAALERRLQDPSTLPGAETFDPAAFGLDRAEWMPRFAAYRERFGVRAAG